MVSSYIRFQKAKKVTFITAVINFILAIGKIFFGAWGGSQALVADGLNSFSDLAVDGIVLFATKASNQAPDRMHPYGHGRIETIFSLGLAVLLILVGFSIAYDVLYHLFTHTNICNPSWVTVVVAAFSVLASSVFAY